MKNVIIPFFAAASLAFTACEQTTPSEAAQHNQAGEATADTAVVFRDGKSAATVAGNAAGSVANAFDISKAKLKSVKFPEVRLPNITVTEDSTYSVYAVSDDVLFDTDKATIKPTAAATLDEIANSIGTRFASRDVQVTGFADSRGDASYNMQLGQERANAVKAYLVKNSKLTKNRVDTESFGEQKPVATNATPAGRQQNRRVEIVVRKK
ncbi:OmpA family protein [Hymenobacter sp. RP-2-7]|uniref:OmpA family protein n=1 Tax=Hymenobacter polaris TaxID=2682546 RepID=A0A7Y0ACQ7_9BACT|nr:OmpA family protein [Hymenobacter polaris]NML64943.1 OmpA family protein [Hymenobacter polaris]